MKTIRAVARALAVLRLMNQQRVCTLGDLAREGRLPAATVFRILQTLRAEGYVQSEGAGRYHLTARACELGAGYTEQSALVDLSIPILRRVTRQIRWPLAIGTLDADAIQVRYSTMPYSPLAVQATTLGLRLGLLDSAMGLVYLASCAPTEREILLGLLRQAARRDAPVDRTHLDGLLQLTRRRGYGLRLPQRSGGSATVAVAVQHGAEVLAVLSMTTFGRSMTQSTLARFVPVLRRTATELARSLAAQGAVGASGAAGALVK